MTNIDVHGVEGAAFSVMNTYCIPPKDRVSVTIAGGKINFILPEGTGQAVADAINAAVAKGGE